MVATEAVRFCQPQNTVVLDTVRQLHTDGYKLAICTNNWTEIGAAWHEGLPLDLFDAVVVSCEIGFASLTPKCSTMSRTGSAWIPARLCSSMTSRRT